MPWRTKAGGCALTSTAGSGRLHLPRFSLGTDMSRRPHPDAAVFVFAGASLLAPDRDGQALFTIDQLSSAGIALQHDPMFVGTLDGKDCFAAIATSETPTGCLTQTLRECLARDEAIGLAAGRAWQLSQWCLDHAYCGRCGTPTEISVQEPCRICPSCAARHYPRVTPAVIVRVEREDRVLLAHRKNANTSIYSLLAGFVEAGESLEEAVAREVNEEVGLHLVQIDYAASQPWPFPGQLMIGFAAQAAEGELRVDGTELDDARWFDRHQLPDLPPPYTISRRLIDQFMTRS